MREQTPKVHNDISTQSLQDSLAHIERKLFSGGAVLTSKADIERYVEAPVVEAVTSMWEKNIPTTQSSANQEGETAWIDIDYTNLSDDNKKIADGLGFMNEYSEENGRRIVKIGIAKEKDDTPDSISSKMLEITKDFVPQKLIRGVYTKREMARMYVCDEKDIDSSFVEDVGMVLGEDDRVYASDELLNNQKNYEEYAKTINQTNMGNLASKNLIERS